MAFHMRLLFFVSRENGESYLDNTHNVHRYKVSYLRCRLFERAEREQSIDLEIREIFGYFDVAPCTYVSRSTPAPILLATAFGIHIYIKRSVAHNTRRI